MNKRDFLRLAVSSAGVMAAHAAGLCPLETVLAAQPRLVARVRPSHRDWPSPSEWEALNARVGGRLREVADPYAACKDGRDPAKAARVMEDMKNPFYVQEQVGATESTGWIDGWTSVPSARAVAATCTADVVAAVDFAREHRLRLVVKGGAHSYLGQSCAADSLLLWTHDFNQVAMRDAFVPQGAPAGAPPVTAVTVDAGAIWLEVYDRVVVKGRRYVQGGGCASVGVAGHLQTGGFGSFSKRFGMSAAGVLELELVTSDGSVRIANRFQNADLFWAWKGAGAAFGIATRVTLRTLPLPETFGFARGVIGARDQAEYEALVHRFLEHYHDRLMNPHWGEAIELGGGNRLAVSLLFQGLSRDEATNDMKPIVDYVASRAGALTWETPLRVEAIAAHHHWDYAYRKEHLPQSIVEDQRPGVPPGRYWFKGDSVQVSVFWAGYESGWLHRRLLDERPRLALARALVAASRRHAVALHFNKGLAGAPPDVVAEARDATCVNPIAADAFALVIIAGGKQAASGVPGHEPDVEALRREARDINAAMDVIRQQAPDAGGYSSEMSYHATDWREAAWGPHYARLLELKKRVDPIGLFVGHHYVGSELWSADGFTPRATESRP